MTAPPTPILKLTDIHKSYNVGTPVETEVLHGITLALREAEFVALKGPSGSGKSTLLNIIGLLERPTAGTLEIADQQTLALDDAGLTRLRGATIGFVFQFHHLLRPSPHWRTCCCRPSSPTARPRPRPRPWRASYWRAWA